MDTFYQDDMSSLDILLNRRGDQPTHIVLFGGLYAAQPARSQTLASYDVVHHDGWNGIDMLQDDDRRKGGVFVLQSRVKQI